MGRQAVVGLEGWSPMGRWAGCVWGRDGGLAVAAAGQMQACSRRSQTDTGLLGAVQHRPLLQDSRGPSTKGRRNDRALDGHNGMCRQTNTGTDAQARTGTRARTTATGHGQSASIGVPA